MEAGIIEYGDFENVKGASGLPAVAISSAIAQRIAGSADILSDGDKIAALPFMRIRLQTVN